MRRVIRFGREYVTAVFRDELTVRSAALAYYAIFSIFPALAVALSGLALLLRDSELLEQLITVLLGLFPTQGELLAQGMTRIFANDSAFGVIGLATLVWSASGYFGALNTAINHIFGFGVQRPLWFRRGLGVVMVMLIGPALLLFVLLSSLSEAIAGLPRLPDVLAAVIHAGGHETVMLLILTTGFTLLYRFVPSQRPALRPTIIGSLAAATLWLLVTRGFIWFLGSRFSSYNIVSSAIDALIALVLWFYISNFIILLGAELAAQMHHLRLRDLLSADDNQSSQN